MTCAPRLDVLVSSDVDELNLFRPPSWDERYWRLVPGRFECSFRRLTLGPDLAIQRSMAIGPGRMDAATRADFLCILFPFGVDLRLEGLPCGAGSVMLTFPGRSQEVSTVISAGGIMLDMRTGLLRGHSAELDEAMHALERLGGSGTLLLPQPAEGAELQRLLEELLDGDAGSTLATPAQVALARLRLVELAGNLLCQLGGTPPPPPAHGARRRQIASEVGRLIWARPGGRQNEPIGLDTLSVMFDVSRRTVQLAVAECYGTSFSAMERTARLQRVRHALRATGGAETVAKIAYRHGFWHLGRFAQHYRALFGVLPSMDISGRPAADGPANRRAK